VNLTARAAVVTQVSGPVEVNEYTVPEVKAGEIGLRVELTGVCGTDAHILRGAMPGFTFPAMLGHEIVGRIYELGDGAEYDYLGRPLQVGDRIGMMQSASCGACAECAVYLTPSRCRNKKPTYGFAALAAADNPLSGGFSQYLVLRPGTVVFKTEIPAEAAVLLEPLSIAVHGVDRARVRTGSTVIVQGVGAIGLMAVVAARSAGAARVVAVGAPRARLDLALRMGADAVVDLAEYPDSEERLAAVRKEIGARGADAVIGCVGHPSAFREAIDFVADAGVVAEVGSFTDRGSTSFNPHLDLLVKNISIEGVFGAGQLPRQRFARALTILERGGLPFGEVVSHRVPLDKVQDALEALASDYILDGTEVIKIAIEPGA
jgi:L-iditol 2-dehydrogenase